MRTSAPRTGGTRHRLPQVLEDTSHRLPAAVPYPPDLIPSDGRPVLLQTQFPITLRVQPALLVLPERLKVGGRDRKPVVGREVTEPLTGTVQAETIGLPPLLL